MAISDSQKVDYLWKKIGYSATKSDNVKAGFEEAIPSPLQIRGDKVMTDSGSIPATIPGANTSILTVYTTSLPYECAVDGTTATPNRTWKTTLTDWVSPEFGSTYQVKVWVNLASSAGNASTAGTSLSAGGSGNSDEWFFDYQAGLLHFIGTNLPNGVSFTGKSVYVSGARYTGGFGVSAPGSSGSVGNLTISNVTISANSSAVSSSANIIFSTSGTGAVQFTGNNAIGLPIGNIANRPTTVNAGYLRFNTEFETIEVWDGAEWVQTSGGVITSDVLNGDGSTAQFALSANTTTTGVLVSINGTIQKPSTAYTVSNNSITFTEIPALGDSIEVRKLSGGTISVNYGNADVAAFLSTYSGLYSNVQALTYLTSGVAGNILPSANVTYSLGSPTRQWKDLFVSNTTIYLGGIPLSIDASGNLLVNGSQVQGSGGSGSGTNYSNTNVAAYTTTQGYTNYSNVNVAAYLSTNNYLTSTTANLSNYAYAANITTANVGIIGYIDRANTIQSNQISAANVGIIGYIDLANTIQSTQISAANLGMRGYVDNQITTIIGSAPGVLDTLGELANALGADANLSVTITSQIANVNANITTANLGMKGYVDNSVSTANIGVIGYIDRANTIQSNQITAANLGIKGYIDNSTSTANIGMKGYVDSVATLSSYSNVNVSALITTNGLTNYSNVNVAAYLPGYIGNLGGNLTGYSGNVYLAGNIIVGPTGYTVLPTTIAQFTGNANTYTQLNVQNLSSGSDATAEYVATANNGTDSTFFVDLGIANSNYDVNSPNNSLGTAIYANDSYLYAQGNLATTTGGNLAIGTSTANKSVKIFAGGINSANIVATFSNTGVAVTGAITATGNVTATGFIGNGAGLTNVTFSQAGNIVGTQSNVTLQAGTFTSVFNNQGNVTMPNVYVSGNVTVGGYFIGNGALLTGIAASSTYSNVQVATYLPTYAGNIANIRLGVAGVLTFADSTTQTTAAVNNNFGNVNVSALITTNGLTNYSNVNTKAYAESMGYQNYGNVNVAAYVTSMGHTNFSNVNVASYLSTATINTTGNITAQNVTGNISITGNIIGTLPNVTITAGTYVSTFNNQGNVILPNVYVTGNVTANYFVGNGSLLSGVATKITGSWTVPTGNSTQSFTVASGTYQLWVDCNIPNGILAWNATATVTNTNVPVVGQQFAWVYNGGGTPIDFTSIPNQFVGTGNTIVRSSTAPNATTNRFDFGFNNTSGGNVTVSYGYVKIS